MAAVVQKTVWERIRDFFFLAPPLEDAPPRSLVPVSNPPIPPIPMPGFHSNEIFESHVAEANFAQQTGRSKSKNNQSVSMAWDEIEGRGIPPRMRGSGGMSDKERKETYLQAYLQNPWISACVDVVAKRITSGGFSIEPVDQTQENDANRKTILDFLLFINENWDFLQFVRSIAMDLLIFGEGYCEIVRKNGKPWKLYKIDCLTMGYELDPHGAIVGYWQQLNSTQEPNPLPAEDVIRWWFPHPRANMTALSPIERILDAVNLDAKMVQWMTTFFEKGAKANYWIRSPGDEHEATRLLEWFTEQYTGVKNAHAPFVTWGDAELVEYKAGAVDVDFPHGRDRNCEEVLTAYNVPPAAVGIIHGGGLSDQGISQEKSLQYNVCDPIKQMIFEKFNFRLIQDEQLGLGIHDYIVSTRYADFRNDKDVTDVQDKRVRNGTQTINEVRQEMGKTPYTDGGDVAVLVASKDIVPVPRFDEMEDEQTQSAQLDLEAKQVANEKAKNPPEPPPLQGANKNDAQPQQKTQDAKKQSQTVPRKNTAKESYSDEIQASEQYPTQVFKATGEDQHTSIMVAFMLDSQTANQLALSGGEPANDLHVTLAYLGKTTDFEGSVYHLKLTIEQFVRSMHPLQGRVSGIGFFAPSDHSDGKIPMYASVDVQGLHKFRDLLVEHLNLMGYKVANDFAYTPHITLKYLESDAAKPDVQISNIPLEFHQVCLAIGDEHFYFPLGRAK